MQRVVRRSDAQSVIPPAEEDDRASNEVLRFVLGGAHDDDSEDDLYETLISKGLVEKDKDGVKNNPTVEEDSWTASCTESYSSSWSASMHDSFGQEASHPQNYQPSPQPYASPISHSVAAASPRRRRRRRGSFDRGAMLPFLAPPLGERAGSDPVKPPPPPRTTASASASAVAASSAAHPRARPPRRKHGSFLESSSTSCCLNDIVEETENTESSAAAPSDFDCDVAQDFGSSLERHGAFQWSGRRVRFGHVEIRSYDVTLDQSGGYGLEGRPVLCPLTLDWRYDGAGTVRKPAILFGYTSYFQQVKLRPTTVNERRARLGILHHMRQPQVKRWEYRALLYQMAALHSSGCIPDRWQERSDYDELDGRVVAFDRVPSEPTRRSAGQGDIDSSCDALTSSWKKNSVEVPSERGVDLPIVPMQWIDHDSRPGSVRNDSWTPLDPVWLDVHANEKKISSCDRTGEESHNRERKFTRHCMPTMPSLWLHDPLIATSCDSSKDLDDPEFILPAKFEAIPFDPIVTSKVNEKSSKGSTASPKTKEWKRSPPGRSNVMKIVRHDIPSDVMEPPEQSNSATVPMPSVPFQWISLKSAGCGTEGPSPMSGERDLLRDSEGPPLSQPSEFRSVPFEDLVTAVCLGRQGPVRKASSEGLRVTKGRSLDEVEWRRFLRSPSTMWWIRNPSPTTLKSRRNLSRAAGTTSSSDDRSLESLSWLEELTKLHRSRQGSIPASLQAMKGAVFKDKNAEHLRYTMVNSPHTRVPLTTKREGNDSAATGRVEREEASRHSTQEGMDCDRQVRSSSEPTSVTGLFRAQPLICLYQDLPRHQVHTPRRATGTVPFVWLPTSSPANRAPNDEDC